MPFDEEELDSHGECRHQIRLMQDALVPFAKLADQYAAAHEQQVRNYKDEGRSPPPEHPDSHRVSISLGDCRRALSALPPVSIK